MSGQQTKDETRWLLRLFAVLFVLLGIQVIREQFRRIATGEDFSVPSFFIAIGVVILLFWLGWRLWRCPSFWDILSWMPQTPPLFLYFQCQYFRMSQHIRCGLVTGVILLIMEALLRVISFRYKGVWFWDWVRYLWATLYGPFRQLLKLLNFPKRPEGHQGLIIFILYVIYFFAIGFIVGWSVSRLREWLSNRKKRMAGPLTVLYNETDNSQ
jgi:hypothetical protein